MKIKKNPELFIDEVETLMKIDVANVAWEGDSEASVVLIKYKDGSSDSRIHVQGSGMVEPSFLMDKIDEYKKLIIDTEKALRIYKENKKA